MAKLVAEYGQFPGKIPYAKIGNGRKNIIYLIGGPGNDPPRGMELAMYLGGLAALANEYTLWLTTRKNGQPDNYGTREMAADTANAIREVFPGGVEAVIGASYGGFVAQYLAADNPGLVPRYILVSTAMRGAPEVAAVDLIFAKHLAAGRNGRAFYAAAGYLYPPGLKRAVMRTLMLILGGLIGGKHHPDYETDVIKEALMEEKHNSSDILGKITDPVLMIGGDRDVAFPSELLELTAAGIPGARLILYPGRGHGDVASDKSFPRDVGAFLEKK